MNLDEVIKGPPGQGIPKAMYIFTFRPKKKLGGLGGEGKKRRSNDHMRPKIVMEFPFSHSTTPMERLAAGSRRGEGEGENAGASCTVLLGRGTLARECTGRGLCLRVFDGYFMHVYVCVCVC